LPKVTELSYSIKLCVERNEALQLHWLLTYYFWGSMLRSVSMATHSQNNNVGMLLYFDVLVIIFDL